jgi:hypothetical protein
MFRTFQTVFPGIRILSTEIQKIVGIHFGFWSGHFWSHQPIHYLKKGNLGHLKFRIFAGAHSSWWASLQCGRAFVAGTPPFKIFF